MDRLGEGGAAGWVFLFAVLVVALSAACLFGLALAVAGGV